MSGFVLKIIAVLSMLVDHTAAILIPYTGWYEAYTPMRMIGRLAFPIFCFLIVEGFVHTRNVYKYMLRLAAFALLSEIPFDLAFYREPFYPGYQNVYITLLLGLILIFLFEKFKEKPSGAAGMVFQVAALFVFCILAEAVRCDYGFLGILLIAAFYMFRENKAVMLLAAAALLIGYDMLSGTFIMNETYAVISLAMLYFYTGERGRYRIPRYVFYAFYPVHLLFFTAVRFWVMKG